MNHKLPRIAVLLTVYNGAKYLHEQIDSISKQSDVDIDIFINIDPSSDRSEEIVENFVSVRENIYLVQKDIKYGSAAKNFFNLIKNFNSLSYDYISLADQDDIWLPNKTIKAINLLKKNCTSGYSSNVLAFWRSGKEIISNKSQSQKKYDHFFESSGPGCTFVITQKLFISLQKFIKLNYKKVYEFKHHDWFIYAFARENGNTWTIDSNYYIRYRQHESNELGLNQGFKAFISRFKDVISGSALSKALSLIKLLSPNHILLPKNGINRSYLYKLFLKSSLFRRNNFEALYLKLYLLFILILGVKNSNEATPKYKNIITVSIFISSSYLLSHILFADSSFVNLISEINLKSMFYLFAFSIMYNLISSSRIYIAITIFLNKGISFFRWNNLFIEGQILGNLVPQSGVIYRSFILKNEYRLSYTKYLNIYLILIVLELVLLSLIVLLLLLNSYEQNIQIIQFLSAALILCMLIMFLIFYFSRYILSKFKKISIKHIKRVMINLFIAFIRILLFNNIIKILLASLIKILIGFGVFYISAKTLNIEISMLSIFILFFINQIIEPLKITPQNLVIGELVLGFTAFQLNLSFVSGSAIKLIIRVFDIFSILTLYLLEKILNSSLLSKNYHQ